MKSTKICLVAALLAVCAAVAFANDTFFFMAGGNLIPATEKDIDIEMRDEIIILNLEDKYCEVTVEFKFYNSGKDIDLNVGFPFFEKGIGGRGKIYDFRCWTNDVETDYSDKAIEHEWQASEKLDNAYVRTIHFPARQFTCTKVNYKTTYGESAPYYSTANYLYGTGSSWKGSIGKITLRITNNMKYRMPSMITMGDAIKDNKRIKNEFKKISDNTFEAFFFNVEPENYTDVFYIELGSILFDDGPKKFPRYFPYDDIAITTDDMKWYRKDQLRILRNTIYALHGYTFKSNDLREFFQKYGKDWYPPYEENPNFSENMLSEIEKQNINAILAEENKR